MAFVLILFPFFHLHQPHQPFLCLRIISQRAGHVPSGLQVVRVVLLQRHRLFVLAHGLGVINAALGQLPALVVGKGGGLPLLIRHLVKNLLRRLGVAFRQPQLGLGNPRIRQLPLQLVQSLLRSLEPGQLLLVALLEIGQLFLQDFRLLLQQVAFFGGKAGSLHFLGRCPQLFLKHLPVFLLAQADAAARRWRGLPAQGESADHRHCSENEKQNHPPAQQRRDQRAGELLAVQKQRPDDQGENKQPEARQD